MSTNRTDYLFYLFALLFALLLARLLLVSVVASKPSSDNSASPLQVRTVRAPRGRILDRNYRVLAVEEEVRRLTLRPKLIDDDATVARVLEKRLGIPASKVMARLRDSKPWVIRRDITVETYRAIRKDISDTIARDYKRAKRDAEQAAARRPLLTRLFSPPRPPEPKRIDGMDFQVRYRRVHPYGDLASKLIGAVNSSGTGICGVELARQAELAGTPGSDLVFAPDPSLPGFSRVLKSQLPVAGRDVVLTIDSRVQSAAEKALANQVKAYKAKSGSVVVLDPQTSEILALAEYPSFDPSHVGTLADDSLQFNSVRNIYEPGSTGKAFTASAALRYGLDNLTEICTGRIYLARNIKVMKCDCSARRKYPGQPVTLARMLECSCNTLASRVTRTIGDRKTYEEWRLLGLIGSMSIPGIGQTSAGLLPDPTKYEWKQARLANVGFGQSVATTRIQLANAYCAIANGGKLYRPYLIKEIHDQSGALISRSSPTFIRRALEPLHASLIRNWMVGTVQHGTGNTAAIEGCQVAGKTGSAEIADGTRGYKSGVVASFCGMAPAQDPRVVTLVTVEKPVGSAHGSEVAAPVFKLVTHQALIYMSRPGDGQGALASAPASAESKV